MPGYCPRLGPLARDRSSPPLPFAPIQSDKHRNDGGEDQADATVSHEDGNVAGDLYAVDDG